MQDYEEELNLERTHFNKTYIYIYMHVSRNTLRYRLILFYSTEAVPMP